MSMIVCVCCIHINNFSLIPQVFLLIFEDNLHKKYLFIASDTLKTNKIPTYQLVAKEHLSQKTSTILRLSSTLFLLNNKKFTKNSLDFILLFSKSLLHNSSLHRLRPITPHFHLTKLPHQRKSLRHLLGNCWIMLIDSSSLPHKTAATTE